MGFLLASTAQQGCLTDPAWVLLRGLFPNLRFTARNLDTPALRPGLQVDGST